MTVENFEAQDPTAGENAGTEGNESQGTQPAPQAPAARTIAQPDIDRIVQDRLARAERTWQQRQDAAIAAIRSEYDGRVAPKPAANDPWAAFNPEAATALRAALERELESRLAPFKTDQEAARQEREDLAFKGEEADLKSRYPEYGTNRKAILDYAIANNIPNVEAAFHSWRSATQWDSLSKQAVTNHLSRKVSQATRTPSVEGRGGGSPSSKQTFVGKDGKIDREAMDEAAKQLFRDAEQG